MMEELYKLNCKRTGHELLPPLPISPPTPIPTTKRVQKKIGKGKLPKGSVNEF